MNLFGLNWTLTCLLAAAFVVACGDDEQPTFLDDGPRPGCGDGDAKEQRYGTACLCCHRDEFGVAGSVDRAAPPVARVVVTDSAGRSADMVPNAFGNFFRHLDLSPPLSPTVFGHDGRSLTMQTPAPHGDCNACHSPGLAAIPLRGPE